MNLSARKVAEVRERDGKAADDRPEHTEKALQMPVKVGHKEGLPAVAPPEGYDSPPKLGDSVAAFYEHYPSVDALLFPEAGDFLRELFNSEHINTVRAGAKELGVRTSKLETAVELHGIEVTEGGESAQEGDDESLCLPSGERWNLELLVDPSYTDPRVLTQLLATDGLSVREAALYLSEQLGEEVTDKCIRDSAYACGLLTEPSEPIDTSHMATAEQVPNLGTQPTPQSACFRERRKGPQK